MLAQSTSVQFLERNQEEFFLQRLQSIRSEKTRKKYTLLAYLLLDAGCRITEAVSMQLHQIDIHRKQINIKSLKKRVENSRYRSVPMSERMLDALAEWWIHLKRKDPDSYLFPSGSSKSNSPHMSRKVAWKVFKQLSNGKVHPHLLRHTFCTNLAAEGVDAYTIKELAGHSSFTTSEIYIHVGKERKELAIKKIDKSKIWTRVYRKIIPRQKIFMLPLKGGPLDLHIGRKEELAEIVDLCEKKVNTLLLGPQGMGKTHILDNIAAAGSVGKVLRIDDLTGIKKTLKGMVITVFEGNPDNLRDEDGNLLDDGGKEALKEMIYGSDADLDRVLTKESVKQLTALLIKITKRHEYSIVIDDATKITPTGITVLEKLNEHFHMIIAARTVKYSQISFLTNFQKIELQPLSRAETVEMIIRASADYSDRIEDFEMFKTHIERSTGGNPKYVLELVDRFRREPYVSTDMMHSISHTTALREWDMSLVVLIALSSLMVLRYIGREMGDDRDAFMLIGGVFMVFALFARNIFNIGKRKYV